MTLSELRSRLAFVRKGGVPTSTPQPRVPCDLADRRIVMEVLPARRPSAFLYHGMPLLQHINQLGLRVNWEKSKLIPGQRISFLSMELDSVKQTARLTEERVQSVLNCLNTFKGRTMDPVKFFRRLLGHMAAALTPLGLLHMRPLQLFLHGRVPRCAWQSGPWLDPSFLWAGVPLEQVSRHAVVFTDASNTGWGATYNGHAVVGFWTDPHLHWHISCLELLAVHLALRRFKTPLLCKHVLVCTDNTVTVAYINHKGDAINHHNSPATSFYGVRSV
ncbi:hypothetical protein PO909_005852 [Leuciscus waleckii]